MPDTFSTRYYLVLMLFTLLLGTIARSQVYVATDGNDTTNTGTIESPYKTLTKAMSVITIGDTIYLRGGIYTSSTTISISKSGKADSLYCLFAYADELPVFDFTTQTTSDGIKMNGWYWYVKGIESRNAYHNGIAVNGSHNIIEKCAVHDNRNTGLQLGNGASYNQIINCDSYNNVDPSQGNADGFSPKLDVGTGNYFYGCRSWQNSDDGYDGYLRGRNNVTTTYENCWCFKNGYLKDGSPSIGNGNGFKMGGSDDKTLMHNVIMIRCLSFDNRVKGFDQNNNKGSMTLYNCTAYNNGTNYGMSGTIYIDSGKVMTLKNCVALGSTGSIWASAVQETNSWLPSFSVTSTDFVGIDTAGVRGPRKANGSLPDLTYMHLAAGSALIDAGTNVGLPFNGTAPDLGSFETNGTSGIHNDLNQSLQFVLSQNYPNPFNPTTEIQYTIQDTRLVTITIYDILGREVTTVMEGMKSTGSYELRIDGSQLTAGVYLYRLDAISTTNPVTSFTQTKKMLFLK